MKVTIKLNKTGIRHILQSDDMMQAVMNVAQGQGEVDKSFVGFDRVQVIVKEGEYDRADGSQLSD